MTKKAPDRERRYLFVLGSPNDDEGNLSETSINRIEKTVSVYRQRNDYRVIATGGFGDHFNRTTKPHRDYVALELAKLKISAEAVTSPNFHSANTVEDAEHIAEFATKNSLSQLEVVTSEYHVERCKLIFACLFPHIAVVLHSASNPPEIVDAKKHESAACARILDQGGVLIGEKLFRLPSAEGT